MKASNHLNNEEKLNFLYSVLNEYQDPDKTSIPMYYSIRLDRFGSQVLVVYRAPATTDIKEQITKFSAADRFNPDAIVVELYTGRSRNVKPMAVYTFEYKK